MREIKFRAWDEAKQEMHHDFQFIKSGEKGNDWILFVSDRQPISNAMWRDNPHFAQQLKQMQFTGLKDKNGVEIYEGDIIRAGGDVDGQPTERIGTVTWVRTGYDLVLQGVAISYGFFDSFPMEVIGNIYENPELLK